MNEYVLVVKTLGTKRWLNSSRNWQQALNSNKDVKKKKVVGGNQDSVTAP